MKAYTDGATSNNGYEGATGGWAFCILDENEVVIEANSGKLTPATNNQCELTAMINACDWLKANCVPGARHEIYSDSAYIINCYIQKWYKKWQINGWRNSKKEPVANKQLWEKLIPFFEDSNFEFYKVEGHSTNKYNNLVDRLAVEAKQC